MNKLLNKFLSIFLIYEMCQIFILPSSSLLDDEDLRCTSSKYPVCTSDGTTFLNECIAQYYGYDINGRANNFTFGSCDGQLLCKFVSDTNISSSKGIKGWTCTKDLQPLGDICNWDGISCRSEQYDIVFGSKSNNHGAIGGASSFYGTAWYIMNSSIESVALSGLSISGKLEESLTRLPNLQVLDLSRNMLTGNISTLSFQMLSKIQTRSQSKSRMQYLNLSDNLFGGECRTFLGKRRLYIFI